MNIKEIKTKIKGEVDDSIDTLKKYSRDASIFEVMPLCVAHPKDTEDEGETGGGNGDMTHYFPFGLPGSLNV